jgi:hypothetical protein
MRTVINTKPNTINAGVLTDEYIIAIQHKEDTTDKALMVKVDRQRYIAVNVPSDVDDLAEFSSIVEFCDYFSDSYHIFEFENAGELRKWLLS